MRIGDILAVRGKGLISKAILLATGGPVSHVGLVVGEDPVLVMEALSRVVTRPLVESIGGAEGVWVLRPKLERERLRNIVRRACAWSAARYGYGKIVLHLMDSLLGTDKVTQKLARTRRPICSWHVAQAFASEGLHFGEPARGVTPAEIFAFAQANPDKYEITKVV